MVTMSQPLDHTASHSKLTNAFLSYFTGSSVDTEEDQFDKDNMKCEWIFFLNIVVNQIY